MLFPILELVLCLYPVLQGLRLSEGTAKRDSFRSRRQKPSHLKFPEENLADLLVSLPSESLLLRGRLGRKCMNSGREALSRFFFAVCLFPETAWTIGSCLLALQKSVGWKSEACRSQMPVSTLKILPFGFFYPFDIHRNNRYRVSYNTSDLVFLLIVFGGCKKRTRL